MEQPPAAAAGGGGYCYGGPHPVDTRVVDGPAWDETQGSHLHHYPPFDLRLFVLREGCYHFVGDPTDFGYRGQTYSYYGAHPVLDTYGGGWCFMIGGHAHWWRPWSPYFTMAGPWYYWYGAYDPFFWNYWPYYAHYYRAYYPRYYGGGPLLSRPSRTSAWWHRRWAGCGRPPAPGHGRAAAAWRRRRWAAARPAPARGSWNRAPGWSSSPATSQSPDVRRRRALGGLVEPARQHPLGGAGASFDRHPRLRTAAGPALAERSYRAPAAPRRQLPARDASGWSGSRPSAVVRRLPSGAARARLRPFRSAPAPSAPSRASPSSSGFRGGGFRSGWRPVACYGGRRQLQPWGKMQLSS